VTFYSHRWSFSSKIPDLAQILEEKNLMLVGDGENFKVIHKMAF
jgi:hypothetical protein